MDLPKSEEEKTSPWQMFFDGSYTQHGTGVGFLLIAPNKEETRMACEVTGAATNNKVEYEALLLGLESLIDRKAQNVEIYEDSQLVVNQVSGLFQCKSATLYHNLQKAEEMMKAFRRVRIAHIPREENAMAKKLVQRASGYDLMFDDDLLGVRITQRHIQVKDEIVQVCGVNILESESDWRSEIIKFLKDPSMKGINPKLKKQSYRYFHIEDELYKKDSQGILLMCLNSGDALLAMTEIHEGFKLINSTPYYAQANGQADSTNKIIKNGIAKMIKDNPREWSNLLLDILWVYHTSKRDAIDCTLYELVYGHEAILSVEVSVRTVRVDGQRHMTLEAYKEAMSIMNLELTMESYIKRVRKKSFKVDDLVWKVRLPMGHKDHFYGKWTPQWEGPFRVIKVYLDNSYGLQDMNGDMTRNINGKFIKTYYPTVWEKYAQNIQKYFPEFWEYRQN
ncbi:hypothetical protein RND81_03G031300 [Saponaria officinalis]|uniref:RNase H type-1 domain-containing protein n=1 Tax=Saponaria officinalis TaxID=3572 RepID=A0AAW1M519_SAPOF